MPEDTENGVPVSHSATMPPTGADSSTPATVMKGNLKLLYRVNSSRKIKPSVSGRMMLSCARDAVYSEYSPPQSRR